MAEVLHIVGAARRWGPDYPERIYGSPMEPPSQQTHASWFIGGAGGEVGALRLGDDLHLAVGDGGAGWHVVDGHPQPLEFDDPAPSTLDPQDPVLPAVRDRQGPLARLRWCTAKLSPGQQFLLRSGVEHGPDDIDLERPMDTLAELHEPPPPSFLARMFGATATQGVMMLLQVEAAEDDAPTGWTPWLAHLEHRGLSFHCWGTEGGGELHLHRAPPVTSVSDALLEALRDHEAIEPEMVAELYGNWLESGTPPASGMQELVPGAPERGHWRAVPFEELAGVFAATWFTTAPSSMVVDRHLSGAHFVDELCKRVGNPTALALYTEPCDDAVVVYFIVGGHSRESGELEYLVSERVWS